MKRTNECEQCRRRLGPRPAASNIKKNPVDKCEQGMQEAGYWIQDNDKKCMSIYFNIKKKKKLTKSHTSSKEAFPALSPMPFIVTSSCLAPALAP